MLVASFACYVAGSNNNCVAVLRNLTTGGDLSCQIRQSSLCGCQLPHGTSEVLSGIPVSCLFFLRLIPQHGSTRRWLAVASQSRLGLSQRSSNPYTEYSVQNVAKFALG